MQQFLRYESESLIAAKSKNLVIGGNDVEIGDEGGSENRGKEC